MARKNIYTKQSWYDMRKRCLNPSNHAYKYYGGRGITIDPRWDNFDVFLKDMGERPKRMTLDRIDSDKGYNILNCRWTTHHVQQSNRRNNNETVGVGFHKASRKWRAYIKPKRRQISLGYYSTYIEAVSARKQAERELNWW